MTTQTKTNGAAIAGLVIGLVLATVFWPFNLLFPPLSVVLAIVGIMYSRRGMRNAEMMGSGKGIGVAGFVINLVSLIGIGIWLIAWIALLISD